MKCLLLLLTCAVAHALDLLPNISVAATMNTDCGAYPPSYGGEDDGTSDPSKAIHREFYQFGRIYDITHQLRPDLPVWGSTDGLGTDFCMLQYSMKNHSQTNNSIMKLAVHTGTHVDSPGHVFEEYYEEGFDVDTLDLSVLNGPALLVDVPQDSNITAEVMESLNIPNGVKRVLFRTLNTRRRLMWNKEFAFDYVGFKEDGAQWLANNTQIRLVGVDYLSAAAFDSILPAHRALLQEKKIIVVEGLKLDDIEAGSYNIHCLPLRLLHSDGSPIRCILVK
ncbi:unnamed protein product [Ilex paraguariensis]|uniref:Cyclase n=1 Tax=Ilex paraguariensis TaxID=185542 RepID=A0ABC8RHG9_9AQUA